MKTDGLAFADRDAFRKWLVVNHQVNSGIWLVFGKAGKLKTLTADEALEEALCFGWIDGQLQKLDEARYRKRFTPRREGSAWSERNRSLAQKLIESDGMTEAGHAAIAQARKAGTWSLPKPAPISDAQVQMLVQALQGTGLALANFQNMPPSVRRTYTAVYLSAKKEDTKNRRLETIIARLKENKKPM